MDGSPLRHLNVPMTPFFAYVTCPHRDSAEKIAHELLTQKLVACANLIDGVTSLYRWEGEIRQDSETVLILKTTDDRLPELIATIRKLHDYNCPGVSAWPIAAGNPDFLSWIAGETASVSE